MSHWEEVDYYPDGREQKALRKNYVFKNFADALDFVNKVADIAEDKQHHPDINFGWGYVTIWLTTHDQHQVTRKDYDLAKSIDKII